MTKLEKIKVEIAKIRDSWEKDCYHDEADALALALQIIDKYAEQEPKVTTTSTDEPMVIQYPQVDGITPTVVSPEEYTKYDMWIGEKQEPCDDVVSREAVIDQMYEWMNTCEYRKVNATDYFVNRINKLPPVRPQEPTGHWIAYTGGGIWIKYYECSECGKVRGTDEELSDYCPNCGARMVEPQESEG